MIYPEGYYLYVAMTIDGKLCKIGRTQGPKRRLYGLNWESRKFGGCGKVRFLAVWLAPTQASEYWRDEEELHQLFAEFRLDHPSGCEWYHPHRSIIDFAEAKTGGKRPGAGRPTKATSPA